MHPFNFVKNFENLTKDDNDKIWSRLGNFYVGKMTILESELATLQDDLKKMKDNGQRSTGTTTKQLENSLPSTIENPTRNFIVKNSVAPTKKFEEKIKLTKTKVIAKFQSLQVNKSMTKA
jgi:hypothetical protein